MQRVHGRSNIARCEMEARVVKPRALLEAGSGMVKIDNWRHPGHTLHEEADHASVTVNCVEEIQRPGNEGALLCRHGIDGRIGEHDAEFVGMAFRRPVVDFRHQGTVVLHHTYARFTPST